MMARAARVAGPRAYTGDLRAMMPTMQAVSRRAPRWPAAAAGSILLALLALLAGCGHVPPAPGASREAVLQAWGAPTARHASPDGGERLEYASGPWGRTTWMVDLDATGRVRAATQALTEARFAVFAEQVAGMTPEAVRRELGTPGERQRVRHPAGELWSWRYPTNDCLWFQVQFGPDDRAVSAGYNNDPRCEATSDARE
jgi:hypothetical protein